MATKMATCEEAANIGGVGYVSGLIDGLCVTNDDLEGWGCNKLSDRADNLLVPVSELTKTADSTDTTTTYLVNFSIADNGITDAYTISQLVIILVDTDDCQHLIEESQCNEAISSTITMSFDTPISYFTFYYDASEYNSINYSYTITYSTGDIETNSVNTNVESTNIHGSGTNSKYITYISLTLISLS